MVGSEPIGKWRCRSVEIVTVEEVEDVNIYVCIGIKDEASGLLDSPCLTTYQTSSDELSTPSTPAGSANNSSYRTEVDVWKIQEGNGGATRGVVAAENLSVIVYSGREIREAELGRSSEHVLVDILRCEGFLGESGGGGGLRRRRRALEVRH
ncbi:hypothetical protein Syun_018471 [Stephania yunnanensis]|uniref:Uncharacterized protein n=1 Tax=Stephania yunnanensis TaxID=152371 RepID=A0AAP0ISC5_9MAGN